VMGMPIGRLIQFFFRSVTSDVRRKVMLGFLRREGIGQ